MKSGFQRIMILFSLLFVQSVVSAQSKKIIVASDGSGNVKTIQQAFDKIPAGNKKNIIVFVKKGIYKERLVLDTRRDFVTLIGEDKDSTIITNNYHAGLKLPDGDTINTWTSATFFIYADNFTAKNITIQNNAGFSAGQAVAVYAFGDRIAFIDCNLKGFQDVLFCSGQGKKQYYKNCYIEGTTDFIFGPSTALFENCHIHSKKNSHVTAASTPREIPFGFVFLNCRLTADTGLAKVSLGRPWLPNAAVAYLNCEIGIHIIPEGWHNWKNPDNEKTARFAEYKNFGPGSSVEKRESWSKQLSDEEASKYTIENILGPWSETLKKM